MQSTLQRYFSVLAVLYTVLTIGSLYMLPEYFVVEIVGHDIQLSEVDKSSSSKFVVTRSCGCYGVVIRGALSVPTFLEESKDDNLLK